MQLYHWLYSFLSLVLYTLVFVITRLSFTIYSQLSAIGVLKIFVLSISHTPSLYLPLLPGFVSSLIFAWNESDDRTVYTGIEWKCFRLTNEIHINCSKKLWLSKNMRGRLQPNSYTDYCPSNKHNNHHKCLNNSFQIIRLI